jgi:phage terminase large subunit-like protein
MRMRIFTPADMDRARGWMVDVASIEDDAPVERVILMIDAPSVDRHEVCGIIVAARQGRRTIILADRTATGEPPDWLRAIVNAASEFRVDDVFSTSTPHFGHLSAFLAAAGLPRRLRHQQGGSLRTQAERVASMYEQGRVRHHGAMPELEEELLRLGAGHRGRWPDRAAAAVGAVDELMMGRSQAAEWRARQDSNLQPFD